MARSGDKWMGQVSNGAILLCTLAKGSTLNKSHLILSTGVNLRMNFCGIILNISRKFASVDFHNSALSTLSKVFITFHLYFY